MQPIRSLLPVWKGTHCIAALGLIALSLSAGCGTTKMSDTARTATEQLLLSSAIDQSINEMNFTPLAGKEVFFDPQYLAGVVDEKYVISSIRQHLLAYGCVLKDDRKAAKYVVEARAGVVGTNRHEVMVGVPAFNLPTLASVGTTAAAIPEIPFAKTTDQRGVAKIAVFAYNQQTGLPLWQSGAFPVSSSAKDTWLAGTGPFQRGTIYEGTRFAGSKIINPFTSMPRNATASRPKIPVTAEAIFSEPKTQVASAKHADLSQAEGEPSGVVPSGHIVRLPPLEQQALEEDGEVPADKEPRKLEGTMNSGPLKQEKMPAAKPSGSLWNPANWFRKASRPPTAKVEE